MESSLHHSLEVRLAETHYLSGSILTLSADVCNLWSTVSSKTMTKIGSLKSPSGSLFVDAKFSPEGTHVATLCKDKTVHIWSIDQARSAAKVCVPTNLLRLPAMTDIRLIEYGSQFIVSAGPKSPFLVITPLSMPNAESIYQLPR